MSATLSCFWTPVLESSESGREEEAEEDEFDEEVAAGSVTSSAVELGPETPSDMIVAKRYSIAVRPVLFYRL